MERSEAIEKGLLKYNTGRPCKYDHDPIRYTNSGICVECARINHNQYIKKVSKKLSATRSRDQVVLTVRVHHLSYTGLFNAIQAVNAAMGLPPEINKPDWVPSPMIQAMH
jgi:hypothetical protein